MANIRIKDQTTDTALVAGDYVIVDNATEGTRKFDLGQKLADIDDDFTDVRQDLNGVKTAIGYETVTPVNLMSSQSYRDHTNVNTSGEYTSENYATFGFYELYDASVICVSRATAISPPIRGRESTLYVFYDADQNPISQVARTSDVVSVPTGAKYVKFSIFRDYAIGNYYLMLEHSSTLASEYSEYFTPYTNSDTKPLLRKKICSFGDSLAAGDNGSRTTKTWLDYVAEYFSAIPYNRGIGSSCVTDETSEGVARVGYSYVDSDGDAGEIRLAYTTQRTFAEYPIEISPWMCNADRANTIPTDTDIIVIIAGTNDIGTVTLEGFKTAYKQMLNNIIARVPNAKVYPCTLPFQQTYDLGNATTQAVYNSYREAIRDISAEYGFEYIDLRSEMGVNAQNYSTYMSDVTHYALTKGKKKMAECICNHLKNAVFIA